MKYTTTFLRMAMLCAIPLLLLATAPVATATDVRLCAGAQGGGYDGVIRAIGVQLANKGNNVTIENMGGSEDLLNALANDKCDYAPAQRDIHYSLSKSNGQIASKVVPVAVLYDEVMTLVCSKASGYDELSDIQEGDEIIVDVIGSGSALTWDNLVAIEAEFGNGSSWSKATPVFSPLDEAAAAMSLGTVKCAFGVGKVPSNWALDIQSLGGVVSWLEDKDINDLEVNGASLYEPVKIPRGSYANKFWTYNVPAVLFRSGSVKDKEVDKLVKRVAPSVARR